MARVVPARVGGRSPLMPAGFFEDLLGRGTRSPRPSGTSSSWDGCSCWLRQRGSGPDALGDGGAGGFPPAGPSLVPEVRPGDRAVGRVPPARGCCARPTGPGTGAQRRLGALLPVPEARKRGLTEGTIANYLRAACTLLAVARRHRRPGLATMSAADASAFVVAHCRKRARLQPRTSWSCALCCAFSISKEPRGHYCPSRSPRQRLVPAEAGCHAVSTPPPCGGFLPLAIGAPQRAGATSPS